MLCHCPLHYYLKYLKHGKTLMSVNRWVPKCGTTIKRNTIQQSKGINYGTCNNVDEPQKHVP